MGITEQGQRSPGFSGIAVLPPGLEEEGARELAALGAEAVQPLRRAVRFRGDLATLYRLHLQARLPFRILRELGRFPCRSREELYRGVQQAADWEQWLPPALSFRVDASGTAPGLNHSHYTALQVKNALVDWQRSWWGQRSSIELDDPDLCLHLHLSPGRPGQIPEATLSVDGSGESLHRRGYRAAMGLAPLKENLAAGLIALTGWDGTVPLVDPLCGSGTLLIEAACKALVRPGLADGQPLAPIVGNEADPEVLAQARTNATAAGVSGAVDLRSGDFREFHPPEGPGVLVCNPPYGERIGERDELEQLYADLGRMAKERCGGWQLWLLSGNPELTGALRMKASRRIPVSNGGIDCRWLLYEIR